MQHVALISILIYWTYVLGVIARDKKAPAVPISDYMETGRERILYKLIAVTSFTLYGFFTFFWFIPTYDLGLYAYLLMGLAYITQMITTFTLRTNRKGQFIHDMAARISGIAAFILIPMVAFSSFVTSTEKLLLLISYAIMTVIGTYLRRVNRYYYLPLQIGLFGFYYAIILYLTYTF
jgi:multidrug transporter EmrE-like cation transporter